MISVYFWKELSLVNCTWIKQIQINFIQMVYILYEFKKACSLSTVHSYAVISVIMAWICDVRVLLAFPLLWKSLPGEYNKVMCNVMYKGGHHSYWEMTFPSFSSTVFFFSFFGCENAQAVLCICVADVNNVAVCLWNDKVYCNMYLIRGILLGSS